MGLLDRLRNENSVASQRERREKLERALTQSLRTVGSLVTQLADRIERQRLARRGHLPQERFLERTKPKAP